MGFIVVFTNKISEIYFSKNYRGEMMGFIEWLNVNSGMMQAVFSGLLLIATVIYVIINSYIHREMERERKNQERPIISLRIERFTTGFFELVIENISDVPIYDVVFEKYPDFKILSNNNFNTPGFVKNGIKYIAPKQVFRSLAIIYFENEKIWDMDIEFEIVYKNLYGENFRESIKINLSLLQDNAQPKEPISFEDKIIKELKTLNESIDKIASTNKNEKNDV